MRHVHYDMSVGKDIYVVHIEIVIHTEATLKKNGNHPDFGGGLPPYP